MRTKLYAVLDPRARAIRFPITHRNPISASNRATERGSGMATGRTTEASRNLDHDISPRQKLLPKVSRDPRWERQLSRRLLSDLKKGFSNTEVPGRPIYCTLTPRYWMACTFSMSCACPDPHRCPGDSSTNQYLFLCRPQETRTEQQPASASGHSNRA